MVSLVEVSIEEWNMKPSVYPVDKEVRKHYESDHRCNQERPSFK